MTIRIGCAGWAIPIRHKIHSAQEGSQLVCYAARYNCVEINSSFYRSHQGKTYARWKDSTPGDFLFSVKTPKTITHSKKLVDCEPELDQFLNEIVNLEHKLGHILVQLPPILKFDEVVATEFFKLLRTKYRGFVSLEARHCTWFEPKVDVLLDRLSIGRVGADPVVGIGGDFHIGSMDYYRLHGSPKVYYSHYGEKFLRSLALDLLKKAKGQMKDVWCIFDNTAEFHAIENSMRLQKLIS